MEHELNGVKRTFPKKRSGNKNDMNGFYPKKKKRSAAVTNQNAPSPFTGDVDGTVEPKKKVKKGSKARRRARSAKFDKKIAAKKAASAEVLAKECAHEWIQHRDVKENQRIVGEGVGLGNMKAAESMNHFTGDMKRIDDKEDDSDVEEDNENNIGDQREHQKQQIIDSNNEILSDNDSFRKEIAEMPMGKVKQLKEKLGIKLFNKVFFGETSKHAISQNENNQYKNRSFMRKNPKRPREMSSKRPVTKFRNVYANEKIEKERVDPRFDDRFGPYDEHIHRTNYAFLEEMRQNEKRLLEKEIQKAKREDPQTAEKIKETLRRINNREKSFAERERNKEVIRELRRENNERMRQGKKPIFLRRAEVKMRVMEKKFEELRKTNKLDEYLERKSKKQNRRNA